MEKILKKIKFSQKGHAWNQSLPYDIPTVCEHSRCPNRPECSANGVATFLAMGTICTRNCLFCAIDHGKPLPLDPLEGEKLAKSIAGLGLEHAVITTVTRDDLADGGARHLAQISYIIKDYHESLFKKSPKIELLASDFKGNEESWAIISKAPLDILGHNMEAIPRIFPKIRPQGNFTRSLKMLRFLAQKRSGYLVKSGFMVGFGEKKAEVLSLMDLLLDNGVEVLTIGQYLPPVAGKSYPLENLLEEKVFKEYEQLALAKGFKAAYCGSFVRSSYMAHRIWLVSDIQ